MTPLWSAVAAIAAVVAALVMVIANRTTIKEYFAEKEKYPRSRGERWVMTALVFVLGYWNGCAQAPLWDELKTNLTESEADGQTSPEPD